VLRQEVEDFLFAEAALLDEWRLDEWLGLLTDDVTYIVPATDARDADPATTLSIISDDAKRLRARAEQLLGMHWKTLDSGLEETAHWYLARNTSC